MNKDMIGGFALLCIAGGYYVASGAIAESTLSDEVGAAGLPRMLAILLCGLGLALLGRALIASRRAVAAAASEPDDDATSSLPRAIGLLLFGAAYIAILPILGYLLSVALLIAGVALYEGAARDWKLPVIAIAGAALYWAAFVKLLNVRQPPGLLLGHLLS